MTITYDPATPDGVVRLLAGDADPDNFIFEDAEITAFLNLNGGHVLMAACQALLSIAASENLIQKKIAVLGLVTDGPTVAQECRTLAETYRAQANAGNPDDPGFDYAEFAGDAFSARELLIKRVLRGQLP